MSLFDKSSLFNKEFHYDGWLELYLDEKVFKLHPSFYQDYEDLPNVIYDTSSEVFKGDKISLNIKKENESAVMTLKKKTLMNNMEEIIKIYIENCNIDLSNESSSEDTVATTSTDNRPTELNNVDNQSSNPVMEREFEEINRLLDVGGKYRLEAKTKFVVGRYEIDDYDLLDECSFVTNPEMNVYSAIDLLFNDHIYSKFGLYIDCLLLDTSLTFSQLDINDLVVIDASPKCLAVSIAEPQNAVEIPWNNQTAVLARRLAKILNIDGGGIRFFDDNRQLVNENVDLDFEKFMQKDDDEKLCIYYNVYNSKVICTPLFENTDPFEVMIPPDCEVDDLKRRLQTKLKKEANRFVICQNNKRLLNNRILSENEEIQYFVTSILEDSSSKVLIGSGGFGEIYKCTSSFNEETIAIKKFTVSLHEEREWASFIREIYAIMKLLQSEPHQNILRYTDLYVDGDDICIGMEFMARGSLRHYLDEKGPICESEIKWFTTGILKGVQFLHLNRIHHQDIKGSNILLGEDNVVKLCDFGVSSILTDYSYSDLSQGISHSNRCGSYRWMAPEVILDEKYGLKSDVWSIGATIIEMITGEIPFPDLDDTNAAMEICEKKQIDFVCPNPISSNLLHFVKSCLTASVTERPNVLRLLDFDFIKD